MREESAETTLERALVAAHDVLMGAHIQHALCGGIAANLYRDDIRTTTDVDVYIVCAAPQIIGLVRSFEDEGWRVHAAWEASELLRLNHDVLPRVDLLVAATDFERQAVKRAVPFEIAERKIGVLRPEDLITFKLVAGRLRDYEAAAAILNSLADDLDQEFIRAALAQHGMEDRWATVIEEARREAEDLG